MKHEIRSVTGSAMVTYHTKWDGESISVVDYSITKGDGPEVFVCACGKEVYSKEKMEKHLSEENE